MEGYSIMDWVTIGGIVTTFAAIMTVLMKNSRDTKAILREFSVLLDKDKDLSEGLSKDLSRESSSLSKEHDTIKEDTKYIHDEMLGEKMARENLYHNVSNAKEILDKMDFMQEVVLQNNKLSVQNKNLINELGALKERNEKLSSIQTGNRSLQLMNAIGRFEGQLANFERYEESDEIRFMLKKIKNELSEYVD